MERFWIRADASSRELIDRQPRPLAAHHLVNCAELFQHVPSFLPDVRKMTPMLPISIEKFFDVPLAPLAQQLPVWSLLRGKKKLERTSSPHHDCCVKYCKRGATSKVVEDEEEEPSGTRKLRLLYLCAGHERSFPHNLILMRHGRFSELFPLALCKK